MKILVTGANGYIGSKVVKQLCDMNIDVIATDFNNTYIDSRATYISANIFENKDNWFEYFNKPDVCLHLAWRDGFVHNSDKHMLDLSNHYKFLTNMISNGLKQVAVMGTMHEIGYFEGAIDENTQCNPLSQYGVAKNALRKSLEIYCSQHNCIFQWLRGFYIYGDDEFGNSIFCKIRMAVKNGYRFFPFTNGKNKFDFLSANELAFQISLCVLQNKVIGIINCCSGIPVSLSDKVEWYISYNKLPIKLDYGKFEERKSESPCLYGNSDKIKNIIHNFLINKTILVTGINGQLGYDVQKELKSRGFINVIGIDKNDIDLTNIDKLHKFLDTIKPDFIFHNAAWTAVDAAEDHAKEVFAINTESTKAISDYCIKNDCTLIFISTDYVFPGTGDNYYCEDDAKAPLSVYGKSKSIAEDYIITHLKKYFIVRISWAFGIHGNNFVKTMLKLGETKNEISVVNDQIGSPTYTFDLAKLLCDMVETDKYGIYHATNEDICSWYDFAKYIFKVAKINNIIVHPISTNEYQKLYKQAFRPLNSRMSKNKLENNGFKRLPTWKDAVERYIHNELKR